MHDMDKEGRAPNDPAFAVAFWAARRLGDPDFAKLLLEMRSKAEYPPRQDFFVQASRPGVSKGCRGVSFGCRIAILFF